MNNKLNVAVVYGGKSGEHEVSLESAASVIKALDRQRFDVIPVGIDKTGQWHLNRLSEVLSDDSKIIAVQGEHSRAIPVPNHVKTEACLRCDVVFPVVHGPLYEDGSLQGILQLAELPFVGCGVLASAMAMDKDVSRRLLKDAGIPTVDTCVLALHEWQTDIDASCQKVLTDLQFPLFVKPARLGSSVGIFKVNNKVELRDAMANAFQYDTKIVVEQGIAAREIELSVLENNEFGQAALVSIPGEIKVGAKHEFYSYDAKYLDPDGAALSIPADLTEEQVEQLQDYAARAFSVLECEGMARVDFLVDKDSGAIYLNELNTIPGFTAISMYPKLWHATGLHYTQLLSHLIDLAIARQRREQAIVRDWQR